MASNASSQTASQKASQETQAQLSRSSLESQHDHSSRPRRVSLAPSMTSRYPHTDSWRHRDRSPDLHWHLPWTKTTFKNGRVLIIDYISNRIPHGGRTKVNAQEFEDLEGLRHFYSRPELAKQAALRIIHVQNAFWATDFLLHKFKIAHGDELTGTSFAKFAKYEKPRRRNGKPFPNGKSWRPTRAQERSVAYTSFSLDFLKAEPMTREKTTHANTSNGVRDAKIMELKCYEEDVERCGYDVYVQRFSVHVQLNEGTPDEPVVPDARRPSQLQPRSVDSIAKPPGRAMSLPSEGLMDADSEKRKARRRSDADLDNSNTIIIFEASPSGHPDDTLIQARNELERRWRRLPFYLKREEAQDDGRMALECTSLIMNDIFRALAIRWEEFLNAAEAHVDILQDKIFENPADESRAPEIWANTSQWLKVEKVMWIHQDILKEMQGHLRSLTDLSEPQGGWLTGNITEFDKLMHSVQEDLVNPTTTLNDLLYKSVGIRDSRHSLQLGTSMWRLSWITFIFLPLTFIVGFFGMNVDTFENQPSIKWYFVSAVVLMVLVLFLWYFVKHSIAQRRQTPYQRGIYERLYSTLSAEHPTLWSESGAVESVQPSGLVSRTKWRLLKHWFAPDRTIRAKTLDLDPDGDGGLGVMGRAKRSLLRRWLGQIRIQDRNAANAAEQGRNHAAIRIHNENGALTELVTLATPVALAEVDSNAAASVVKYSGLTPLSIKTREGRDSASLSEERPGSRGSSGMMIEERYFSDGDADADDGQAKAEAGEGRDIEQGDEKEEERRSGSDVNSKGTKSDEPYAGPD